MPVQITNTKDVAAEYIKILVHGPSGAGKTRLSANLPDNIIISAEGGLLSLKDFNIDVIEVKQMDDLRDIYSMLLNDEKYKWVTIDSISEIAEVCLSDEKGKTSDGRRAYGEMQDKIMSLVRAFRNLNKNIYVSAKQERVKDEVTGGMIYGPSAPGQRIGPAIPYLFDEVFALHNWKDAEGVVQRALQTQRDAQYDAKDRSGQLDFSEPADLLHIYNKITNKKEGD